MVIVQKGVPRVVRVLILQPQGFAENTRENVFVFRNTKVFQTQHVEHQEHEGHKGVLFVFPPESLVCQRSEHEEHEEHHETDSQVTARGNHA